MTGQDLYALITKQIVELLEQGTAPWRRPWSAARGSALPSNAATGRTYSGINVLALFVAQMREDYSTNRWLTYRQAKALGGYVRPGEHGTTILIVKRVTRKRALADGEDKTYTMASAATVFNLDQVEGVELAEPVRAEIEPHAAAEALAAGYLAKGPALFHGGDRACYSVSLDAIAVPERNAFITGAAYYSTLFHEIAHSTGHPNRLDRDMSALSRECHSYAREELVAEFAASFLRGHVGIEGTGELEQSAAYLRGWAAKLREDPGALAWAATQAQRAADLVIGRSSHGE